MMNTQRRKNKFLLNTWTIIFVLFLCLFHFLAFNASAQRNEDLYTDPKSYSLALWYHFLQKEGSEGKVMSTIQASFEILKKADQDHGKNIFSNRPIKVLISKTPDPHKVNENTMALPFMVFLEEEAPLIIAFHAARLLGGEDPSVAGKWAMKYLDIKPIPTWRTTPDYLGKLKSTYSPRLDDFLTTDQLKDMVLTFRILNDQEGLMVPIEKESSLIYLLEGNIWEDAPAQEIPMVRLLNQVELKLLNSLIKDIKFSEMDNDRVEAIGEMLLGFLAFMVVDQRLKLIQNGWIRKPARFLTFTLGFFVIQAGLESGAQTLGIKKNLNKENVEKRSQYETILLFLTGHLEKAKIGNFNMEHFKKDFYYTLKLNLNLAKEIHILDDEKTWTQNVEQKVNALYQKKAEFLEKELLHIDVWLSRLEKAKRLIDSKTGLVVYEIPERSLPPAEQSIDYFTGTGMTIVIGEFAYNKIYKLKKVLYSGKLFGGIAISALTLNYLFGVTDHSPLILEEEDKIQLESDLKQLKIRLPEVIQDLKKLSQSL